MKTQKIWTDEDVQFLKDNYIQMSCQQIAAKLGRTTRSVQHRFNLLKLVRPIPKVGDTINRLTVKQIYVVEAATQNVSWAKCDCSCGKETNVKLTLLTKNKVQSCGCVTREKSRERAKVLSYKHGQGDLKNRLYRIWAAMKCRCSNPNVYQYQWYGAKGVKVCEDWKNDYMKFHDWSMANGYGEGLSIDRIDVNGNYCPENCRWATAKEQGMNRTSTRKYKVFLEAFGEKKSVGEWEEDSRCVVDVKCMFHRIGAGWTPEEVITTPSERA